MREDWVKKFNDVGLELRILDKPKGFSSNDDVFQMDVGRKVEGTRRTEWFEIYPGHEDNTIQILDVDSKLNQILLLVHEAAREFEVEERKRGWRRDKNWLYQRREQLHRQGLKFRETKDHIIVTEKTPSEKRHFLMGVDERQLFVAQLTTGVNNINAARGLLGNTVKFHEGVRKMSPKRQGEWFFLKATREQEDLIDLFIEKQKAWIINKANIGQYAGRPRGNPHVADELVVISDDKETIERLGKSKNWRKRNPRRGVSVNYNQVYVRGKVRHIDHKTIKYSHWYQVVLNNEGATENATRTWID